ncbi:hypothetical protein [Azospirillum lipoferum]|uniref:Uncharacterized protein n=1 Tax=Azospirillum lipoferum (strain 4B) TaxID=862719 RepID=G7Z1J4_AZOL4|nr:hypothetical protein [Azospirillum lipoferum]CBS87059.1 protein of unknown function [Azospirillum lipoferum 4B]
MTDQPKQQQPDDAKRDDQPGKPAGDTGKIDSRTEKAQEEAANDRAREGGYQ